jgi:hypothetical protein
VSLANGVSEYAKTHEDAPASWRCPTRPCRGLQPAGWRPRPPIGPQAVRPLRAPTSRATSAPAAPTRAP